MSGSVVSGSTVPFLHALPLPRRARPHPPLPQTGRQAGPRTLPTDGLRVRQRNRQGDGNRVVMVAVVRVMKKYRDSAVAHRNHHDPPSDWRKFLLRAVAKAAAAGRTRRQWALSGGKIGNLRVARLLSGGNTAGWMQGRKGKENRCWASRCASNCS